MYVSDMEFKSYRTIRLCAATYEASADSPLYTIAYYISTTVI